MFPSNAPNQAWFHFARMDRFHKPEHQPAVILLWSRGKQVHTEGGADKLQVRNLSQAANETALECSTLHSKHDPTQISNSRGAQ